jgi:hypothetical protein
MMVEIQAGSILIVQEGLQRRCITATTNFFYPETKFANITNHLYIDNIIA